MKMKIAILLAAAFVTLTSLPVLAQQADATAQQSTAVTAAGNHANGSSNTSASVDRSQGSAVQMNGAASGSGSVKNPDSSSFSTNGSAAAVEEMRPVNAELQGKLDSKSAKAGDQVVMKTKESVKTADGTVIPKGTRLVGHVTSVQAHGKGSADSQMAIQLDRAEMKGGQSMPIRSEIRSVTPPAAMAGSMESDDSFGPGPIGGGMVGGGAHAVGGARAGGGGLLGGGGGGAVGGTVGGVVNTTSRAGAGLGSTVGSGAQSTGHMAGNAVAGVGGRGGNLAGSTVGGASARATGVRGVMLAGDTTGRASGMLTATNRNVHLDGGTQMVVGVSPIK